MATGHVRPDNDRRGLVTGHRYARRRHSSWCPGLALVTAVVLLAGCGDAPDSTPPPSGRTTATATPALEAAAALGRAAARLGEDSFAMSMTVAGGSAATMTGAMDPVRKVGSFRTTATSSGTTAVIDMRVIGDDTFIKVDAEGLPQTAGKPWRRVRAGAAGQGLASYDGAQIARSLEQVADVTRVGDRGFRGTLDLAKAAGSVGLPSTATSALAATKIPFEASIDGDGRLVRYVLQMPRVGGQAGQKLDITYSNFGAFVDVDPPPADQVGDMSLPPR